MTAELVNTGTGKPPVPFDNVAGYLTYFYDVIVKLTANFFETMGARREKPEREPAHG